MSVICIITARGGSKRIPRKNIKDFCGKPIIAYSIEAALKSEIFDEVMVSTDDEEIAEISRKYGASVPFMRSTKNSDDFATTVDVLHEVVNRYKDNGVNFDWLSCIYPTAPFVTGDVLKDSFNKLLTSKADALTAVVKFSFPPQRAFIIDDNGLLKYKYSEFKWSRSQDLESLYHDAGQFYFWRVSEFVKVADDELFNTIPYELTLECVQDIDNISDWRIAEIKYKQWIG